MYTLAMADIRLEYVVYVPNTLTCVGIRCVDEFAEANIFLDMFKIYQRMRAYNIRYSYAYHTHGMSHTMNTLIIRLIITYVIKKLYERRQYAMHTFVKAFGR